MSISVTNTVAPRNAVLFVRIQQGNKDYLNKQAKDSGFKDTASYLDAVISEMKGAASAKKTSKKSS